MSNTEPIIVSPYERHSPGAEPVDDTAQTEKVRANSGGPASGLLRGHVGRGAHKHAALE